MFDNPEPGAPLLDIGKRCMLVNLSISVWSGNQVDQDITQEVEAAHDIEHRNGGVFTKQIICKPALRTIKEIAGQARSLHYRRTLPWNDLGGRLLSVTGYTRYTDEMATLQEKFDAEIAKFVIAYPAIIQEARNRLKAKFNIDDYPPNDGVRQRFDFGVHMAPFPTSRNWVSDMADDELAKLRDAHDARVQETIGESIKHVYGRVMKVTKAMADKLGEYERDPETDKQVAGGFKDSLVTNVQELASLLPDLNITNDPHLTDLALKLQELTRYNADQLKIAPPFRKAIQAKAQSVCDMVAGMM